jgi:hypothetical protein
MKDCASYPFLFLLVRHLLLCGLLPLVHGGPDDGPGDPDFRWVLDLNKYTNVLGTP